MNRSLESLLDPEFDLTADLVDLLPLIKDGRCDLRCFRARVREYLRDTRITSPVWPPVSVSIIDPTANTVDHKQTDRQFMTHEQRCADLRSRAGYAPEPGADPRRYRPGKTGNQEAPGKQPAPLRQRPHPLHRGLSVAAGKFIRQSPTDIRMRFWKFRVKATASGDAKDLGPYFFEVQKILDAPPPPPIEGMHEIPGYDE
jgi:hypothetical protein